MNRAEAFSKRIIDVSLSSIGLLLLTPLMLIIAVIIKATEGGPVIFREYRLGLSQQLFLIYKFGTLATGIEGPPVAPGDDPRIHTVGHLLRRYHLDELPQLVNVLRGEMSLVGPRPMKPSHGQLVQPRVLSQLLSVKPGLTGADALAFIAEDDCLTGHPAASTLYAHYLLPEKIRYQLQYIHQQSLWLDLSLLYRTLRDGFSADTYQRSLLQLSRLLPANRSPLTSTPIAKFERQ